MMTDIQATRDAHVAEFEAAITAHFEELKAQVDAEALADI